MKTKLLFIGLFSLLMSCDPMIPTHSDLGQVLDGEHLLVKLRIIPTIPSTSTAYFVVQSQSQVGQTVTFSWTLPDSTVITNEISYSKVRLKIDPSIETPYIKFRWKPSCGAIDWVQVFKKEVVYIVIYCKEEDFPNTPITNL